MKELNILQMEEIDGGGFWGYVACRAAFIGVGAVTGVWAIGFAGAFLCPSYNVH